MQGFFSRADILEPEGEFFVIDNLTDIGEHELIDIFDFLEKLGVDTVHAGVEKELEHREVVLEAVALKKKDNGAEGDSQPGKLEPLFVEGEEEEIV